MIRSQLILAFMAATVCTYQPIPVAAQQTSVRLEESTGTSTRSSGNSTIDIKIGSKKTNPGIRINEPGQEPDPDEVTLPQADLPVSGQNSTPPVPSEPVITEEDTKPEQAMQSGTTTQTLTSDKIPTPTATIATPAPVTMPADVESTSVSSKPASPAADDITYLPPATLGAAPYTTRDGQKIAMRPEELSSVTATLTVPDVYSTTLTSGLRFYHLESNDLPRVRVSLIIQAGQNFDPADKVGLAELTVRTMRAGGAAGKTGDEIDRQLEQIGSDLEFNVERDYVSGSMFALTDKTDEAMALLTDVMLKPEFDEKKFELEKASALEQLRRQNDQPDAISRREFRKIVYGADSPLARTPTSASINSITRDDVRAFHDARFRPSTVWVGLSGDITQDAARALLDKSFGTWDRPAAEAAPVITVDESRHTSAGVYFTQKATAQSQIRMGHLGIARNSPQVYAANVLNSIYGTGGFSSRLMNQVRTKHGYVYGVGGGIFSDDPLGLFAAVAASQSGTTGAAIKEILNVTKSVVDGPISPEEVETARRDVFYTFAGQFDTPSETLNTHMLYDYRGYPADYLKNFPERIRSVTAEDVQNAAGTLMRPDKLQIYVIGNADKLDIPLSEFGTVQQWELGNYNEE